MKNGCQKYLDTVPSRTDFLLFSSTFLTYSHRYNRMYLMYLECAIPVQQYDHYCTVQLLSTQTPLLMISIVQNKLQNNKSIDIYSVIAFKVFFHLLIRHTPPYLKCLSQEIVDLQIFSIQTCLTANWFGLDISLIWFQLPWAWLQRYRRKLRAWQSRWSPGHQVQALHPPPGGNAQFQLLGEIFSLFLSN